MTHILTKLFLSNEITSYNWIRFLNFILSFVQIRLNIAKILKFNSRNEQRRIREIFLLIIIIIMNVISQLFNALIDVDKSHVTLFECKSNSEFVEDVFANFEKISAKSRDDIIEIEFR